MRNLRARLPELTALLEECSSHSGFEDPIYRFYHQSFKMYSLQDQTSAPLNLERQGAVHKIGHHAFPRLISRGSIEVMAGNVMPRRIGTPLKLSEPRDLASGPT